MKNTSNPADTLPSQENIYQRVLPQPKWVDYQGQLTKDTALYGEKHIRQPAAIGLQTVTKAVQKIVDNPQLYRARAQRAQKELGDPTSKALDYVLKPTNT